MIQINRIIQSNQVTIYWKELIQPDREIFVVIILDTTRIVNKCVIDRKQDITMSCISPSDIFLWEKYHLWLTINNDLISKKNLVGEQKTFDVFHSHRMKCNASKHVDFIYFYDWRMKGAVTTKFGIFFSKAVTYLHV